jgi:lipooligosaccharide transport system permease protein
MVVHRHLDVYLQTWKTNLVPPLLEPLLYLLALGYGLGALIESVDGLTYPAFIAPALLAITAMQGAFFETTYNSYVRYYWQKTWEALHATPLSAGDILLGEILWAALRATFQTFLMGIAITVFGLFGTPLLVFPQAFMILPLAFAGGLIFASIGLMFTAKVRAIDQFSYAMYLFVTPMFLFSGTFFPLSQLPVWAKSIAYGLPLTHLVAPIRAWAIARDDPILWWSALYLSVAAVVLPMLAMRMAKGRVVQ